VKWTNITIIIPICISIIFLSATSHFQIITAQEGNQEKIREITFHTIIVSQPSPRELSVVNVTSFTLNGTNAQIREQFSNYEPSFHNESRPAVFEGLTPNQTYVVDKPTKEDYLSYLDTIVKDPSWGASTATCWFISIQGPALDRHYRC
jgi:hypothetical protein